MPTSDEDLAKQQADVQKLRDSVAAEEQKAVQLAQELSNDVVSAQLTAEADTLQAQLAELKARNTKTAVKEGAAAVLDPDKNAAKIEEAKAEGLVDSAAVSGEQKGN